MVGDRYRIEGQPIGYGGMGVVYKAFDTVARRFVALKTLKGEVDRNALEMFQREWSVLAQLSHPNIVDVLDIGDYTENGQKRPYFVMPLLPGCTLNALIQSVGSRLTGERVVEMVCQASRGLQAAHDRGLVHRDLKPSNLFVMSDDTVKVIDFGIVHLTDAESRTSLKGTLHYMAPEQLEMRPASARSDIYSLGVVCYEALTGRKPFERSTEEEVVEAIRTHMPAPVSELNASINDQVSRAVHKAMAKQPYHRFASVREFAEMLQRSLRNEHIEMFDRARIQPRLNRVNKALNESDYQLAIDILDELQSEGNLDPEMPLLRMRAEQATRSKAIYHLIESARTRMEEEEYPLALQNIQRVLDIDPANVDALAMKSDIERHRSATQIEKWLQIGRQHCDNRLFGKARQAVEEVFRIERANGAAGELLEEISRGEQDAARLRKEKQQLYESALTSYRNGEISSALKKLEQVIDIGKRAPGQPNTDAHYLAFYEQVRGERDELHNLYSEGKKAVDGGNFARALEICATVLEKRPGEPLFKALKIETEDLQRQENSSAIAQLHSQIQSEADLDRKFTLLKEAAKQFPDEQMFSHSLKLVKERRDLVNSIVSRARHYESKGLFAEASNQWDILRSVYSQYPGLEFECQRLARKQELHAQEEAKASQVENIDRALFAGEYARAEELVRAALSESPGDAELVQLQQQVVDWSEKDRQALTLLNESGRLVAAKDYFGAVKKLRTARELNSKSSSVSKALVSVLVEHARNLAEQEWRAALPFIEEALQINPSDPGAASVSRLLDDARKDEQVERYLKQARDLQLQQKLPSALEEVERGLREFPGEIRLGQMRTSLCATLAGTAGENLRSTAAKAGAAAPVGFPSVERQDGVATSIFSGNETVDTPSVHAAAVPKGHDIPRSPAAASGRQHNKALQNEHVQPTRKFALFLIAAVIICGVLIGFVLTRQNVERRSPPATAVVRESPPAATPKPPIPIDAAPKKEESRAINEPLPPQISSPRKATATVYVDFSSNPSPAQIIVDGEPRLRCLTPCPLALTPGVHNVKVTCPNFIQDERVIRVPEETSLSIILHEELIRVRIASDPTAATLTVDGEAKGVTPITLPFTSGRHKFVFTKDDLSAEKSIEVNSESSFISATLRAERADKPANAELH